MLNDISDLKKIFQEKVNENSVEFGIQFLKSKKTNLLDCIRVLASVLNISNKDAENLILSSSAWKNSSEAENHIKLNDFFFDCLFDVKEEE